MGKWRIRLSKAKRRLFRNIWIARITILGGSFLALFLIIFISGALLTRMPFWQSLGLVKTFLTYPLDKIKVVGGRTNILILGKAGKGQVAPDLTDTIIVAFLSHSEKKATLVSIPRDIWIAELRTKVNSVYYWGNQRMPKGGLPLAKATVEEIVGESIAYGVVIDFEGFMQAVDIVGGIEVDVERTFTDEKYPIAGRENDLCGGDVELACRYETVKFEAGKQVMDGETALKFVRSRNAEGEEGTDIARAARQQKVLDALKNKLLTKEVLFSPRRLRALYSLAQESVETDITRVEGAILLRGLFESRQNLASYILPEEFLENPPVSLRFDNQYVFVPKAGNWSEVRTWIKEILPP